MDFNAYLASTSRVIAAVKPWFFEHGITIISILIGAYLFHFIANLSIERLIRKAVVSTHYASEEAEKKREDTLIKITHSTVHVSVIIFTVLMIISELGVDIGPLIAGAGIIGLALGFGGQYLVRDLIAGLFLILENQFRVGDAVCLGDICGKVEDVTLRKTILRDLDGTVHHVPNGEISRVSNKSKDFARVNLNIGVSYDAKLDHVIDVVNRVGDELAGDPKWKDVIKKKPQFLRVDDFGESDVVIKILGETKPQKQWDVMGELRKRLKQAFDKEGIEIPYPQRVVHHAKE